MNPASFRNHSSIMQASIRLHPGNQSAIFQASSQHHSDSIIQASILHHSGINAASFSHQSDIIQASIQHHSGITPASFRHQSDIIPRPFYLLPAPSSHLHPPNYVRSRCQDEREANVKTTTNAKPTSRRMQSRCQSNSNEVDVTINAKLT